jgi:hypothetical protein
LPDLELLQLDKISWIIEVKTTAYANAVVAVEF